MAIELRDDRFRVRPGETVVFDVLANDSIGNGETLELFDTDPNSPTGIVRIVSQSEISYTAPADFTGTEFLSYDARDQDNFLHKANILVDVYPDGLFPQTVELAPVSVYETFLELDLVEVVDAANGVNPVIRLQSSGGLGTESGAPAGTVIIDPGQLIGDVPKGGEEIYTLVVRATAGDLVVDSEILIPFTAPNETTIAYDGPSVPNLAGNNRATTFDFRTRADDGAVSGGTSAATVDAALDTVRLPADAEVVALLETFSGVSLHLEDDPDIFAFFGTDATRETLDLSGGDIAADVTDYDRFAASFRSQSAADAALEAYVDQLDEEWAAIYFLTNNQILGVSPLDFTF